MSNPFEKRATEYIRDDEAFLAVVTPEPLTTFFQKHAADGSLYDRLTTIIGTPGSGKTTLSRLFQYQTLRTLLRNSEQTNYRPLLDSLNRCGAIENNSPAIVGCRLPLETEYRDFWEFPYPDELKSNLMIALLQARAVLGWLRNLQAGGHELDSVEIIPRADAEAATLAIGGTDANTVLEHARKVEFALYNISAALVPPDVGDLENVSTEAYRPFDVIEAFRVRERGAVSELRPLVILDDAHILHPLQLTALMHWLIGRELKVARWLLMRLDALNPETVLSDKNIAFNKDGKPGLIMDREVTQIKLQSSDERGPQRRAFRKMAKDMANRYLARMDVFSRRRLQNFGDILMTEYESISSSNLNKLKHNADIVQRRNSISENRRKDIEGMIDRYFEGMQGNTEGEDIRLAMLSILMERYVKRVPQKNLFSDPEPSRPLKADSTIAEGARIHLLHKFKRPCYFGIDCICDASSENAEIFLKLASWLVSRSETQIIRGKGSAVQSKVQHQLLRKRASQLVSNWDFPLHKQVRKLTDRIAAECLNKSLEPNASLGGGATAIGILQTEFDSIPKKYHKLAAVLHYGVAYNAINLVQKYGTKKRLWCLIELGGVLLLHHGLTLKRGGFLEYSAVDLNRILGGD